MEDEDILSMEEAFYDLRDPRSRRPAYDLQEMLVVALCAILCGADNWVQLWGEEKQDWLRRHIAWHTREGPTHFGCLPHCPERGFIWREAGCLPSATRHV
ncbi:DDE_Tnp_1-associated [Burkholderia sp. GAS332]|nr:DDE_Tnp_1-associated [Burkholderia sp. GAS332]